MPKRSETEKSVEETAYESCRRCGCCDEVWEDCQNCGGDGLEGHDCGEDSCCCLSPEDNRQCDICDGDGGWYVCLGGCDKNGKHKANRTAIKQLTKNKERTP